MVNLKGYYAFLYPDSYELFIPSACVCVRVYVCVFYRRVIRKYMGMIGLSLYVILTFGLLTGNHVLLIMHMSQACVGGPREQSRGKSK